MDATIQRLVRARQLVELRRWSDAEAELAAVLAAQPDSAEALCLLAQTQLALDRRAAATTTVEAALQVAPDSEWAHRIRSVALSRQGRHDEAVAAAREAVRCAPSLAETHVRLAGALLEVPGGVPEARAAAAHAVALDPHSPSGHLAVGVAAGRAGDVRTERAAYQHVLSLEPDHAMALNNLAAIDMARGRLSGASRMLTGALRRDPNQPEALRNLDTVATQVVRRSTLAIVFGGLVVATMASADEPAAWWARAVVGLGVLTVAGLVGYATLRHLPAGARLHLRGWLRRARGFDRVVAGVFVAGLTCLVGTAFLPQDPAEVAAVGLLIVFRIVWLIGVVMLVRLAIDAMRRR